MRRLSALIGLILASSLPLIPAAAQTSQRLQQLNVALWPEYDRSAVLVIYQAELPADVTLPATVELPIPLDAGQPHAVASLTDNSGLVNADFQVRQDGPWSIVSVQAEASTIWLEYYQDLTTVGDGRSFTYVWPGTIPVDNLTFEVQEPVGSSNLQIQPAPSSSRTDGSGLTYRQGGLGSLAAGQEATIDVEYTKSGSTLTADVVPPPTSSEQTSRGQGNALLEWPPSAATWAAGLGTLGLVALLVAGVMAIRARRPRPRKRGRGRRSRAKDRAQADSSGIRFCPQCGKTVRPADRFCRHCGAKQPDR
jgi:hypothetical protein